ncbi:MAG: 50S ribosomal protein L24 [Methanobacteriota archaeon]
MKKPSSKKPGKQRKWLSSAPHHKKRKMTSAHMSTELLGKYGRRSLPVRKGDTVLVKRGESKGLSGEVTRVNPKIGKVYVEGLTVKKMDGTDVEKPLHASNLEITDLHLEDRERREVLEKKISK